MKESILSKYKTSINGLNNTEVNERQIKYGFNELEEKKPKGEETRFEVRRK